MVHGYSALVLGSTGLVGQHLLEQLLKDEQYTSVTSLSRSMPMVDDASALTDKLNIVLSSLDNMADHQNVFDVDHVYVCLGTTIKQAGSKAQFKKVDHDYVVLAAQLAQAAQCKRFVWVSSVGADASSSSFYLRTKGKVEETIMKLQTQSGNKTQFIHVNPSLLLGERDTFRLAETVAGYLGKWFGWLMIGPLRKYRPVHASDVANWMRHPQQPTNG
ncbi:NAD(P)H-binding protein [Aestuariibacter sp. AA17]|uniref:NAD(P)H-binding protein n=1 Tax=Fluctibacter corallii TaxID=2984329 RepID=A0ABT3A7T1_9ALTE|nr:NAD(P)H-binding protein [Aestuariibacter sp. AA17]MCV2884675.1 NAD(P)H-binding protein [Aestuariibacter sp. AA17]